MLRLCFSNYLLRYAVARAISTLSFISSGIAYDLYVVKSKGNASDEDLWYPKTEEEFDAYLDTFDDVAGNDDDDDDDDDDLIYRARYEANMKKKALDEAAGIVTKREDEDLVVKELERDPASAGTTEGYDDFGAAEFALKHSKKNWKELARMEELFWDEICSDGGIDYFWFEDDDMVEKFRRRIRNNDLDGELERKEEQRRLRIKVANRRRRTYKQFMKYLKRKGVYRHFMNKYYISRSRRIVLARLRRKKKQRSEARKAMAIAQPSENELKLKALNYEDACTFFCKFIKIPWLERFYVFTDEPLSYVAPNTDKLHGRKLSYTSMFPIDLEPIRFYNSYLKHYRYPHDSIFHITTLEEIKRFLSSYSYHDAPLYQRIYTFKITPFYATWYSSGIVQAKCARNLYCDYLMIPKNDKSRQLVDRYNSCAVVLDLFLAEAAAAVIYAARVLIAKLEDLLLLICIGIGVMLNIFSTMHENVLVGGARARLALVRSNTRLINNLWDNLKVVESDLASLHGNGVHTSAVDFLSVSRNGDKS